MPLWPLPHMPQWRRDIQGPPSRRRGAKVPLIIASSWCLTAVSREPALRDLASTAAVADQLGAPVSCDPSSGSLGSTLLRVRTLEQRCG
jgi:hypothetical protein